MVRDIIGHGRNFLNRRRNFLNRRRTFLNRRRIESGPLEDGDELQISKYKLTFLS